MNLPGSLCLAGGEAGSHHLGARPVHVVRDVGVHARQLGPGAGDAPGHQPDQGALAVLDRGQVKYRHTDDVNQIMCEIYSLYTVRRTPSTS